MESPPRTPAPNRSASDARRRTERRCGLRILLGWWALGLGPGLLAPIPGVDRIRATFALATLVALWPDPRRARRVVAAAASRRPGPGAAVRAFLLAGLAGWLSQPLVLGLITGLGVAAGAPAPAAARAPASSLASIPLVVLAPLFEEVLYRGRLLPLCVDRVGPIGGVALASLAFALPHARPWPIFGAFATGLLLGALRLRTGDCAVCVALHAGWNAAARFAVETPGGWPAAFGLDALAALPETARVAWTGVAGFLLLAWATRTARPPNSRIAS